MGWRANTRLRRHRPQNQAPHSGAIINMTEPEFSSELSNGAIAMAIETVAKTVETDATKIVGEIKPIVTDVKTLAARRAGDVLIAVIVIGSICIGHAL
jgi:hypothetical protein